MLCRSVEQNGSEGEKAQGYRLVVHVRASHRLLGRQLFALFVWNPPASPLRGWTPMGGRLEQ